MGPKTVSALLAGLIWCGAASAAPHALVKRGLQEARCVPASLVEAIRSRGTIAYEVVCREAPDRKLVLVCTPHRCFPDEHRHDDDRLD